MRIGFVLFSSLMMLLASARSLGASSARLKTPSGKAILVSADSFYRDADAGFMELKGHVQIIYGEQHLSCDRAVVRLAREEVEAEGNILILSPTTRVEGSRAVMNYVTETGIVYNGYVESQQIALDGETIRKTGPRTYEAERANFTACTTCPPAWQFSGREIKAELGGYARIKNPLFKIAYFPIPIWLPYIIVPLKSDRQTGFLTPLLGSEGPGGTSIQESYFWAISRSEDATFYLKNYQFRGPKGLANYRFQGLDETAGEGNAAFLQDQVFVGDVQLQKFSTATTFNRYFVDYKHALDLPDGFSQKTRIGMVSDLYYLRDFPEDLRGYGDPALESRASLTRNDESSHASIDASYYVNLLERNPISSNADAVHRLPELRYSIAATRMGDTDFFFGLDMNYVNFVRNSPSYDAVAFCADANCSNLTVDEQFRLLQKPTKWVDNSRGRDPFNQGLGQYIPGQDVIRTGQRFDIRPEISAPFHLGRYLDVLPSAAFRHTQYGFSTTGDQSGVTSTPARDYAQAQISARTRFSRIYEGSDYLAEPPPKRSPASAPPASGLAPAGDPSGGQEGIKENSQPNKPASGLPSATEPSPPVRIQTRYKHEIVPELSFTTLPYFQQANHPFFGSSVEPPPFMADQPISDTDFTTNTGVQFDYNDRVINRNVFTMSLANKLIRKRTVGLGDADYKQVANFRLTQSYDLDQARLGASGYPLSDFAALLDVRLDHFETNTVVRYFPYHGYANTSSRVRLLDSRGDFFQVSFSQAFLISEKIPDPNSYLLRTENIGVSVGLRSKYVDLTGNIDYDPLGFTPIDFAVVDWVAQLTLKPPGDCWGIGLLFQQVMGSAATYKVGFEYKFGG
jgi:LPS-assembly protein